MDYKWTRLRRRINFSTANHRRSYRQACRICDDLSCQSTGECVNDSSNLSTTLSCKHQRGDLHTLYLPPDITSELFSQSTNASGLRKTYPIGLKQWSGSARLMWWLVARISWSPWQRTKAEWRWVKVRRVKGRLRWPLRSVDNLRKNIPNVNIFPKFN